MANQNFKQWLEEEVIPREQRLNDEVFALLRYANEETGGNDTTLGAAVIRLVQGYGGGGGYSTNDILTKGISGVLKIDGNPVSGKKIGVMPVYAFADQSITDIIALDWEGVYATSSGYTFANNTRLVNVTMPKLKYVSSYMFSGCSALQTIDLPFTADSTAIGGAAFSGCTSLRLARLGWQTIAADNLFQNCANLDTLILPYNGVVPVNAPSYWAFALKGTKFTTTGGTIYVPGSLVESYKTAANWSTIYNNGLLTVKPLEEAPTI